MRRGLMGWNPDELPRAALDGRLARLQAAMRRDGLDAFLLYTNLVRPSAVCWLTGFTPYWIDSLLLVRHGRPPTLATALSKRVADWIRTASCLEDIVNTPKPGTIVGQTLAAAGARRVGVLELDALPSGMYDDIAAAAPQIELSDASKSFAASRRTVDDAERKLIAHADALAVAALGEVDAATATDAGAVAGLVERHARLAAAEEAYIAVAPDLDADRRLIRVTKSMPLAGRFAVRASIAYKGNWVRRIRTFARNAAGAETIARGDSVLARAVTSIKADQPYDTQLIAALKEHPGAQLRSWMVESCVGSYPLEVIASARGQDARPPADGDFFVLTAELAIDGTPWLGAAPGFVGELD